MKYSVLAWVIACFAIIAGCSDQNPTDNRRVHSFSGPTMGTSYTVKFVAEDGVDIQSLQDQTQQVLDRINGHMSTYQKDSELSIFNQTEPGDWFEVSAETAAVISLSLEVSELTGGAFDTTVGPLVNLWGFGPDPLKVKAPSDQSISNAMKRVGYQSISVKPDGLAIRKSINSYVDLSAIAKGYAVDEVAKLIAKTYPDYLIEVGGELKAHGSKLNEEPWMIAVESPVAGTREVHKIISVNNIAIATSGDYRNYFEQDGVRYSHTIDPLTGKPVRHKLASVTVLDPSSAKADAMATALMVLGEEKGLTLAKDFNMPVFMIYKTEEGFAEVYTDTFKPYLKQ